MPILWTLAVGQAQALVHAAAVGRDAVRRGAGGSPQAHAVAGGDLLAGPTRQPRRDPAGDVDRGAGSPAARPGASGNHRVSRLPVTRAGGGRRQSLAVRRRAAAVGDRRRRWRAPCLASGADALGVGGGRRPLGWGHPAASRIPADRRCWRPSAGREPDTEPASDPGTASQ